ncbi:putative nuclease HARBI1 [Pecten maximus]|uniref:putative nuclease HARBI1 n=1 Tax=Pecten maximus TaxID=6579 RepID=UPI001458689F|nr:putative nuclease HARBI1 [Pecten maximus]
MPNVVGAIDGTLVPVQAPILDEHVYVCKKGYHAINVQAICTHSMKFINVICKWPGSVHDSFILTNSEVGDIMEQQMNGWLLGDSGYPLRPWLLTPVGIPTTRNEEKYNRSHMKTRNVVERAFGMLKSRFRCLHKSTGCILFSPAKTCQVIYVCFLLHNMCIDHAVDPPENFEEQEPDHVPYNGHLEDGRNVRSNLIQQRF